MRRRAKATKPKVDAKPPIAREVLKSEGSRVHDLDRHLAEAVKREAEAVKREEEALEQQRATAEILRVMSSSLAQLQPVLDAIAERASRLCDASNGTIILSDGEALRMEAHYGPLAEQIGTKLPIDRRSVSGRAFIEGHPLHVDDLSEAADFPLGRQMAARLGIRTFLAVPLVREAVPIGLITMQRTEVRPFSDKQIELLETFADQAVIAIENVRLFKELEVRNGALTEALQRETATGEVLRLISSSPTDVTPVFDGILRSAVRLAAADYGATLILDGDFLHLAASYGTTSEWLKFAKSVYPLRVGPDSASGQAIMERRAVFIEDAQGSPLGRVRDLARTMGYRSQLMVPMLRQDAGIGVLALVWQEARVFPSEQLPLLQTFADQAVIAIENVRLFKELEARNRDLTEALEQQTATSEILRVISSSPTDLQPVLDTIATTAAQLCDAHNGAIFRFDGEVFRLAATYNVSPEFRAHLETNPIRARADYEAEGMRTALAVPMLKENALVGAITIHRREVRPLTDKQIELVATFASQAVIAIENVRLFKELEARNSKLTTALDQQTATSDILRVISRSQTDVQPVFDTIVRSAKGLLGAFSAMVVQRAGDELHLAALSSVSEAGDARVRQAFPIPIEDASTARPILTPILSRQPFVISDAETQPDVGEATREIARARGYRSQLVVPLLREHNAIGVISVTRREAGGFTQDEVALLQTFADQAVIAIENVRLFTELQQKNEALTQAHAQVSEALEQQTATSDILRVISSSPTDVQPVFDAIAKNARRLLHGHTVAVTRLVGKELQLMSYSTTSPAADAVMRAFHPLPVERVPTAARAVHERTPAVVSDIETDPTATEEQREVGRARGFRSFVYMPMVRDDVTIGVIAVTRQEAGRFTDGDIALLKTFADQAVIAIENVRLFTELRASNRELTTALDTQTATSDILRVISRSQTDVQPVFDAILASAVRLLRAHTGALTRIAGDQITLAGLTSADAAGEAALRARFPQPLHSEDPHAQVIRGRVPLNVADAHTDARWPEAARAYARVRGYRSAVVVPLLRHDEALGSIGVNRREPGGFTDDEIALLQTFADQAVIAIENARLLSALQARTQELTRSVEQLTALGDVGRAVSSSLDLDTVLTTIVGRAVQLSGTDGGTIFEYDEDTEEFSARATLNADESQSALLRATRLRRGEGAVGQMAVTREPLQIPDIAAEGAYEGRLRGALLEAGTRAVLAIPLLHEERTVGGLVVTRRRPGAFTAEIVEILKTFATQSALAIQNARLFREIADKSAQLEAASRHKSEFLANMSHELRTPLNAIIGFSEVLSEGMFGEINEKQTEYLRDILESGRHLLSLINDILDLSKIEAGRMELELSDFHLPSAIENALILVRERASRRGIRLGSTIDERLGTIGGDERKVKQVLLNLLSNALKFTPEGGRIDVGARLHDGVAEVSVADTGIGIAPADQDAIDQQRP